VPVLEAAPPAQRSAALRQLQGGGLEATLVSAAEVAGSPLPMPMAAALVDRLGGERQLRSPGPLGPGMHGRGGASQLDVRLLDGQWVRFSLTPQPWSVPAADAFVRQMLIALAVVVAVSLLAVRYATRPLRQLAEAADALGRNLDAVPLPETGPLETRRAVRAFNGMQQRLRRMVAERSRALAAVSHDLRTPLTRLRLRAELVGDRQLRQQMVADVADMQAMIEATLDYLRDLRSESPRPIDLNALLSSLAQDERSLGRQVTLSGEANAPYVGRLSALKRAIANLVNNAIQYAGAAELRVVDEAGRLQLIVEDRGPGIAPAELARVTEPYYRVDASRSRETGGVGLGLAIAKDVAVLHGGELQLENRPGGGLRATLVLPRTA
jgi:signal transduction histidine kinase